MSQKAKAIFALVAVSLSFGAVQLAFGQDLKNKLKSFASASEDTVNRGVKADRLTRTIASPAATQTVAFRVDRFPTTSILVRIPAQKASGSTPAAIQIIKDERKAASTVACEPVVSVLTEVAKSLQPGRCVT